MLEPFTIFLSFFCLPPCQGYLGANWTTSHMSHMTSQRAGGLPGTKGDHWPGVVSRSLSVRVASLGDKCPTKLGRLKALGAGQAGVAGRHRLPRRRLPFVLCFEVSLKWPTVCLASSVLHGSWPRPYLTKSLCPMRGVNIIVWISMRIRVD